jgi:hypothetical protein
MQSETTGNQAPGETRSAFFTPSTQQHRSRREPKSDRVIAVRNEKRVALEGGAQLVTGANLVNCQNSRNVSLLHSCSFSFVVPTALLWGLERFTTAAHRREPPRQLPLCAAAFTRFHIKFFILCLIALSNLFLSVF